MVTTNHGLSTLSGQSNMAGRSLKKNNFGLNRPPTLHLMLVIEGFSFRMFCGSNTIKLHISGLSGIFFTKSTKILCTFSFYTNTLRINCTVYCTLQCMYRIHIQG